LVAVKKGLLARGRLVLLELGLPNNQFINAMLRSILRISAVSLLAAAIAGLPLQVLAQTTNKPAAAKKSTSDQSDSTAKKKAGHPFRGKLAAVDQTAKTIKIGESTYQITSKTRIVKAGKPATLEEAAVGDEVGGYAQPTEDGKMTALSLRIGPKPAAAGTEKKKDATPK
jgi:hypothetical protein